MMYKLIREDTGETVGYSDSPVWIYLNPDNHCYNQTTPEKATGVMFNRQKFQLGGRPKLSDEEVPVGWIREEDMGPILRDQEQATIDQDAMLVDQELRLTMLELGVN